jgi:hypothetical protein
MNVVFQDFWESHRSDYIVDFPGDVTKSFLSDIARQLPKNNYEGVAFTSVYRRSNLRRKFIQKIGFAPKEASLLLYGKDFSSNPIPGYFNVWYSAENIRPPLSQKFDYYLSYDLDNYGNRNTYLPLWLCRLGPTLELANASQESLMVHRRVTTLRELNFCMVASNPEQIRNHFVERLKNFSNVDVFGRFGSAITNKNLTLQKYNFNICFENDLYPGYVTEKAIESYLSGCIPVWRGLDSAGFLNHEAIIDITKFSIEEGIEKIIQVSKNAELMQHMRSLPILKRNVNLTELILSLKNQMS